MLKRIEQVRTFEDPTAAQAWKRATATRATVLAAATTRMLELARIEPGGRVLVIGAGTGDEALDAVARVRTHGEVIATDASEAMVEELRWRVARARIRNVRCLHMDAQHLDFGAEYFDAVIARNVLQFIPEPDRCLREISRVLKRGSRLGVTVWASAKRNPARSDPLQVSQALGFRPPPTAHLRVAMRLGAPGRLGAILRAVELSDVTVESIAAPAFYPSPAAAVKEVMDHPGTRQLLSNLPAGAELRFAAALTRRWQRYSGASGTVLPGEQLVAGGTRT